MLNESKDNNSYEEYKVSVFVSHSALRIFNLEKIDKIFHLEQT
jgi:hypothetical protein